jgi:protein-S-isoprenylcysteine O-methyltransferase Ste14
MNPLYSRITFFLCTVAYFAIRSPHIRANKRLSVAESRKGKLEVALLAVSSIGMVGLPIAWCLSPVLHRWDYPLHPALYAAGTLVLLCALVLFYLAHAQLGTNWSVSLEMRKEHRLMTTGVYRRVRHPMYAAIGLYCLGQALLIPSWVAGPSGLVSFALLFALRLGPEEKMMLDRFGAEYEAYRARTYRLVPWIL